MITDLLSLTRDVSSCHVVCNLMSRDTNSLSSLSAGITTAASVASTREHDKQPDPSHPAQHPLHGAYQIVTRYKLDTNQIQIYKNSFIRSSSISFIMFLRFKKITIQILLNLYFTHKHVKRIETFPTHSIAREMNESQI